MTSEDANPIIRYDKLVENALRSVVKQALTSVEDQGLPGNHHFYITFMTEYSGVNIPEYLTSQYPEEMTIVLQYQFYGLEIYDDHFTVTLSFNNVPERLTIPYEAVTIFADPSVNFALQFQPSEDELAKVEKNRVKHDGDTEEGDDDDQALSSTKSKKSKKSKKDSDGKDDEKGKVVSLDTFRKK